MAPGPAQVQMVHHVDARLDNLVWMDSHTRRCGQPPRQHHYHAGIGGPPRLQRSRLAYRAAHVGLPDRTGLAQYVRLPACAIPRARIGRDPPDFVDRGPGRARVSWATTHVHVRIFR